MTRRLLGPVGGPILFVLAAALVCGVLGWVTHSALEVEQAQREAAARAELGSNLRVALWRLDGRMLPALGVEDSRPFYHYGPADPAFGYGVASTPLLVTPLPDWMKLHFQLDAENGWESPQVPSADAADRIRQTWPDLPLMNCNSDRVALLADLRNRFPAAETLDALTGKEHPLAADAAANPPGAANPPAATGDVPAPAAPSVVPKTTSDHAIPAAVQSSAPPPSRRNVIRFLGIDICICRDPVSDNVAAPQRAENPNTAAPSPRVQAAAGMPQGRSANPVYGDNNGDSKTRQNTVSRAMSDVQAPPATAQPKGQGAYGNSAQNTNNFTQLGNEFKNTQNTGNPQTPVNPASPSAGGGIAPPTAPATPVPALPVGTSKLPTKPPDKLKDADAPKTNPADDDHTKQDAEKAAKLAQEQSAHSTSKKSPSDSDGNFFSRCFVPPHPAKERAESDGNRAEAKRPAGEGSAVVPPPTGNPTPIESVVPSVPQPPLAIHLGSMRAQWVVGPDHAEMLVLFRIARVDNKPVCQGILLDWNRLEATLKDEVKDLFPEAKLLPVRDPAEAPPDRVMTALPVQLDPGPQSELPPAGWTALRLGLALAWAAAIVACIAVGFCGWTLIDLAERRIRFVSAVTHELRTPLTSLRLYLDLLVSGMIHDEAKKQEYLHTLANESDRLHRLIDNVLDFARLEKRRQSGDIKPVRVADLLEALRQTWTERLAQDGKEFVVVSTVPESLEVKTDTALVQQIVGNLIDNARKYARDAADKRIWLWAKPVGSNRVALEVEDRGPGVPTGERRTIFKPFRRGEHADRTSGGAGLGLALAKSWTEALGGTLAYRSADGGAGACFRLELPA